MALLNKIKKNWKSALIEDFEKYEEGPFSEGYTAISEVHYPSKKVFQGPWQEISNYHWWGKIHRNPDMPNWKIIRKNGRKVLKQTCNNKLNRKNWKYPIKKFFLKSKLQLILAFPALSAGDFLSDDYCFTAEVNPFMKDDLVGVIFRIIDGQRHYIFGIKKNKAYLMKRFRNDLKIIASKRFHYICDQYYELSVIAQKNRIQCLIDDELIIDVNDESFQAGKIGLMGNVPAIFRHVEAFIKPEAYKAYVLKKQNLKKRNKRIREKYPGMNLWKKIDISNLCSGRTVRFGDLTGNGIPDLLIAQGRPMSRGTNYNMITCLTAIDYNGNILWQKGNPSNERHCFCSDLAFQIYDIDGDGLNEVICTRDFQLEILDGRTGEIKLKIATPDSVPPYHKFPNIIGDAIYICNLTGKGKPQDILLKDRYSKIWAYDNRLSLLWEYQSQREMGHFPYSIDFNNDGKDEILVGYSLLDAHGHKLWELPLRDHADAVAIIKLTELSEYLIIIAASDEGLIFADIEGRIKKQLRLGHMQTVTIAKLIPDSTDYYIATNTYWGSPGIIYILDLNGGIVSSFQPSIYGSPIGPVNWTGEGQEFILLSAAPDETGGLYDGLGNQAVAFPDDGHPILCYDAFDLNGDGLDELICWDHDTLWVYACDNGPGNKSSWRPQRFPAPYNASNYRSNISI